MHYIQAKSLLSSRNGINIYRGCQHGCIYCDSRSTCYGMTHAFEDIAVKENALELLDQALLRKRRPCMIGTGSMSDPYMPLEAQLQYTRRSLELIHRRGFGAALLTKSDLVLRDLELLRDINRSAKCVVQMTVTTYDDTLCSILEPGVCVTSRRFQVLQALHAAGIPTIVWLCPILPYINDNAENINSILDCCVEAGVHGIVCFDMGLTLRQGSREYFYAQLDRHFPGMKERYIRRYGDAYVLSSPQRDTLLSLLHRRCREAGMLSDPEAIFSWLHTMNDVHGKQLSLFE